MDKKRKVKMILWAISKKWWMKIKKQREFQGQTVTIMNSQLSQQISENKIESKK